MLLLASIVGCTGTVETDVVTPDMTSPTVLSSEECDSCGGACTIEALSYTSRLHSDEPVDYVDTPPAGGPHNPCWAAWGVHTEPVPDDNWVHNLEHGGVVFLYNCPDGCDADVEGMTALATDLGGFALLTPYGDMDDKFAAVSFGMRLLTDCFDESAWRAFYEEHADHGPESTTANPGSTCM